MKQRQREEKNRRDENHIRNKMSMAKATIRNIVDKLEKVIQHYIEKKSFF